MTNLADIDTGYGKETKGPIMVTPKQTEWKRPYLAPRVDRTQRKSVEGKNLGIRETTFLGSYGPS